MAGVVVEVVLKEDDVDNDWSVCCGFSTYSVLPSPL